MGIGFGGGPFAGLSAGFLFAVVTVGGGWGWAGMPDIDADDDLAGAGSLSFWGTFAGVGEGEEFVSLRSGRTGEGADVGSFWVPRGGGREGATPERPRGESSHSS